MNTDLLNITVDKNFGISFEINGVLILFGLFILILGILYRIFNSGNFSSWEIDETELGIGNQKIKLKPSDIDSQIAYKIWVELSTRKIGLPIDVEKDVIYEIYDSWYQFFGVTRELIKETPVRKLRRPETRNIIKLSISVLNNGVRPHLTEWQARFRRWYEKQLTNQETLDLSPQELQKNYPHFEDLKNDLLIVNKRLIKYRQEMYKLAVGIDKKEKKNGK